MDVRETDRDNRLPKFVQPDMPKRRVLIREWGEQSEQGRDLMAGITAAAGHCVCALFSVIPNEGWCSCID